MNKSELQIVYNYPIYSRELKNYSDKGFVNLNNGAKGGTHWTCFYVKGNESLYLDSFGGYPEKFLLDQLPKPITYHKYKIQVIFSRLCGTYCLYFFYRIERKDSYDASLKRSFD